MGKKTLFLASCLLALTLLVAAYSNFFDNSFHFDDNHVIQNNLYIRNLKNVPNFFSDASTGTSLPANAVYRPLVTLSLAVDYGIQGGLDPRLFHITQFLLFIALGVMIFFFYRKVLGETGGEAWAALFGAVFFCLHTVNTETLNIISARSELLSALGLLGSFLLYLRGGWWRRSWLFLVPMVLGALAKVPAVMLAPLLFAYIYFYTPKRPFSEAVRRTWPVFVIGVLLFLFIESMKGPAVVYATLSRLAYARTQPFVWLHYFRLFYLPTGLTADTDWGVMTSWLDPRFWSGVLFLAILGASVLLLAKAIQRSPKNVKYRPIAFGLAWFAIALLPSSSVFPLSEVSNEHRVFLPYIGLVLAFAQAARLALASLTAARVRAVAASAAAVALLGAHAWGTYERNKVWTTEETLWADVVEKSPRNGRALMNYGLSQMARGRLERAREYFEKALVYTPNYSYLETNLGIVNARLGVPEVAEAHFYRALELEPRFAAGHFFYARWLLEQGKGVDALLHLEQAQKISPGDAATRKMLMTLYAAQGDEPRLRKLISETLAIAPGDPDAQAFAAGRYPGIQDADTQASFNQGQAFLRARDYAGAALAFRKAVALDPQSADACNNLGWALAKLEFYGDALPWFDRAVKIRPQFDLARNNLAWARSQMGKK